MEQQAELKSWQSYCRNLKHRRNSEVSRANKAQRLLVDTTVETTMSALQAKVDAGSPLERPQLFYAQLEALRSAGAAAEVMKEEAAEAKAEAQVERQKAHEAVEALEAAHLAQRRVRIKLKGRFHSSVRGGAVAPSPEPRLAERLPAGCRLLEAAIPEWEAAAGAADLEAMFARRPKDRRVSPITAGQDDKKRLQAKLKASDAKEFPILKSFTKALEEAGAVLMV